MAKLLVSSCKMLYVHKMKQVSTFTMLVTLTAWPSMSCRQGCCNCLHMDGQAEANVYNYSYEHQDCNVHYEKYDYSVEA